MKSEFLPKRVKGACPAAAILLLGLAGAVAGHAESSGLFDQLPDPRTTGSLPPAQAASAEPLRPSMEFAGGALKLQGDVPAAAQNSLSAFQGTRVSLGANLPLELGEGIGLETKPSLTGMGSSAGQTGAAARSPELGFALEQTLSLELPRGFRLSAEATLGDRLGLAGTEAAAPAAGGTSLALRAGATLSTELSMPFMESRLQLGLGIARSGLPLGGSGATHPLEPAECRLSLDVGRVGGTPLRISAPCPQRGTAGLPISLGFKTEF